MLGFCFGKFDILRAKDLQELDEAIQKNKEKGNNHFALAIYDNDLCEALSIGTPLKNTEDRMKIMQEICGVDFVFSVPTKDRKIVSKIANEEYKRFLENEKNKENKKERKKYKLGYAPGTYDLFHCGHLENLLEASKNCKKLVVGVKSDALVKEHKNVEPIISASERMEILRHFKFVDNVYQYYTRDPHTAMSWIESKYGQQADAMFLGSDLKDDFKNIKDINIVFTDRDLTKMKTRSSSGYRKKVKILGISVPESKKYTREKSKAKNKDDGKLEVIEL